MWVGVAWVERVATSKLCRHSTYPHQREMSFEGLLVQRAFTCKYTFSLVQVHLCVFNRCVTCVQRSYTCGLFTTSKGRERERERERSLYALATS